MIQVAAIRSISEPKHYQNIGNEHDFKVEVRGNMESSEHSYYESKASRYIRPSGTKLRNGAPS